MKKITSLFTTAVALITNISTHKPIWPNSSFINNNNKSVFVQFQFLKGQTRLSEFRTIASSIFNNENIEDNKTYSSNTIKLEDVIEVLGNYDTKIGNKYYYYLSNSGTTVKAIIYENNIDKSLYCVIQK